MFFQEDNFWLSVSTIKISGNFPEMMNLPLSTGINRDLKRVPRTTFGDRDHRQDVKEKTHRVDFF